MIVVDPKLGKGDAGLGAVVVRDDVPEPVTTMLARHQGVPGSTVYGPGRSIGRELLHKAFIKRPARLVYFGHVTAAENGDPASESIHLSDGVAVPGYASALYGHRPLSALDQMVGPRGAQEPHPYWPMPPRVALIGCGSGQERRHREPFGLVSAVFAAGARHVTATRWPLRTDHGLEPLTSPGVYPTSHLLTAVDVVHGSADPFGSLNAWKRCELTGWRMYRQRLTSKAGSAHSPLLWGALADFEDPDRGSPPWPESLPCSGLTPRGE